MRADRAEGKQAQSRQAQKKRFRILAILASLALVAALGTYVVYAATSNDAAGKQSQAATDTAADSASGDTGETSETDEPTPEKAPIPVETTEARAADVSSYISATANLVPENEVQVLAEWEGRVARLAAEEGQAVAAGQVLAELARGDAEIALEKAQVKAANARMAYERAQRLAAQELLATEALDKTALEHQIAQQELAEAEWNVEKTTIRAPFSGRVTERKVQPGQHVRPGDELFTVADFDPLVARVWLPEREVLSLAEGREVRLTLKADESVTFAGRIRRISPVVDTASGTVKVTVEAVSPPKVVRPGAFIEVDVVQETRRGAVVVPRDAVVRELQRTYVFVARGGTAEKRAVTLGLEEGPGVEAVSGVEAGERIIVAGQGGLKDGSPVHEPALEAAAADPEQTDGPDARSR
jgi:membrane fusion protein (multidrug efflux system)